MPAKHFFRATIRAVIGADGVPSHWPFSQFQWSNVYCDRVEIQLTTPQGAYAVEQLVVPLDVLDIATKRYADDVKRSSEGTLSAGFTGQTWDAPATFHESGLWVVYDRNDRVYTSEAFRDSAAIIQNHVMNAKFDDLIRTNGLRKGDIKDIEFYHTHPSFAEPLSVGDQSYFHGAVRAYSEFLSPGGSLTFYAVPMRGPVIFGFGKQKR